MIRFAVTAEALDTAQLVTQMSDPRSGALSIFTGIVRNHDPSVDGEVAGLEYSAHPEADNILERLTTENHRAFGSHATTAFHRVGSLAVGDTALVVAVMNAHRREAQDACSQLVETIKAELPVWKKEVLVNGEHVWVAW